MLLMMAVSPAPAGSPPSVSWAPKVFFAHASDTLTANELNHLEIVAEQYRRNKFMMQITGYTDRTGSTVSNQRLSERRAKHVACALVLFGVARGDMEVSGRGENVDFVPTAPGVAEPYNRRVEIAWE